jgi:glycosyltransferase 2 family protein
VSIVSLGAVIWWISRQEAPRLPDSAEGFGWLLLALTVSACTLTLRGWRWHRVLRYGQIPHRRRDAYGLTLVAYMGNNVLPARGGELLKIGLLGARTTARRREIFGTVLVERFLDAAVLAALFAALTWAGVKGSASNWTTATLAAAVLCAAAIGLAVYLRLRRRGRFERFAAVIRPIASVSKLFARREGARLGLVSVVIWCLEGVTFMCIARSIEIDLAPLSAIAVVVLASLAAAIPAAPGYVGTFDAAVVVGLHAAGIKGGEAVGVLLLARFIFFVPVTIVGLGTLVLGYGGRLSRAAPDGQELLTEQPPRERQPEIASRQPGAGG